MDSHKCDNEDKILHNWHDIRLAEERIATQQKLCEDTQKMYNQQHEEMMTLIKEINDCQQQLIKETIKINTTFNTLKWVVGILTGIVTFLVTSLIGLI